MLLVRWAELENGLNAGEHVVELVKRFLKTTDPDDSWSSGFLLFTFHLCDEIMQGLGERLVELDTTGGLVCLHFSVARRESGALAISINIYLDAERLFVSDSSSNSRSCTLIMLRAS